MSVTERALRQPSFFFWLVNVLLLSSAWWVALELLSPALMAEVLAIPDSGARGVTLGLVPLAASLVLGLRARVSPPGSWATLMLAACLINAATFFAIGTLVERSGAVEKAPPISILA